MSTISLILIILAHLLIYSVTPFFGSILQKRDQIIFNYTYIGVLFTLVQFFDSLYAIKLTEQFTLNGGDVAYSAMIFATIYLIITQPEEKNLRNLIYLIITTAFFLFLLFSLLIHILQTSYTVNYLNISHAFLEFSFKSLLLSLFLFSSEVILILYLVQKLTNRVQSTRIIAVSLALIYSLVIVIDGIIYPLGVNLLFENISLSVVNGIVAKLIFGVGFGTILILLILIRPRDFQLFIQNHIAIMGYILPPRFLDLKQRLEKAEEKIEQLEKIVPICAWCKKIRQDEGYWDQLETFLSKHSDVMFSHSLCPECAPKVGTPPELD